MKNWNKICGFIAIFFLGGLVSTAQVSQNDLFKNQCRLHFTSMPPGKGNVPISGPLLLITPDYYTMHFGFFCKKELALEKATKIPIRFRLGSVEHCNYLEGKKIRNKE